MLLGLRMYGLKRDLPLSLSHHRATGLMPLEAGRPMLRWSAAPGHNPALYLSGSLVAWDGVRMGQPKPARAVLVAWGWSASPSRG